MRHVRAIAACLLALAVAAALASPAAAAEFGPIQLISKTPLQQAEVATSPAISADGRYVAFQGTVGAWKGVFREDLGSGAIERVAAGRVSEPGSLGGDAKEPSISADGRYVSFTTSARLDPDNDTAAGSLDVYVRDMDVAPPQTATGACEPSPAPCAYEIASALDGCDPASSAEPCGLTYVGSGGSEASGRVALSGDGREVAFFTTAESNLTSGSGGSTPGVPTPALQVVVRNLETNETTLVSTERDPGTGMTERPVAGGALTPLNALSKSRGAALSADGTTVAWLGANLPRQVGMYSQAEAEEIEKLAFPYDEPLWRRIADGPEAPIRRVVGGDGPADPFPDMAEKQPQSGDLLIAAPGWIGAGNVTGVPSLSANGRLVALVGQPSAATNAFVVDMAPGLTRRQAVMQLTTDTVLNSTDPRSGVNQPPHIPLTGHVFEVAISANGERVAFVTARQRFPQAQPALVGSPPVSVGQVELYVVDRETETMQRVTHGVGGFSEPSLFTPSSVVPEREAEGGAGASAPSLGADGLIAFASTASNLVGTDSNGASDVFLVQELPQVGVPGASAIQAAAQGAGKPRRWRLTLSAASLPDGAVRIVAGVPAAGRLRASVASEGDGARASRALGAARQLAPAAGKVAIELRLPRRLRRFARTREGVYAIVRVSFHSPGRKALRGRVQVRFHAHGAKGKGSS